MRDREADLKRIENLRSEIIKHDISYSSNKPTISDGDYDKLYMELVSLEDIYPEAFTTESPTQKIYTNVVDKLEKVKHSEPMLSQEKVNSADEVKKFLSGKKGHITVQEKLDGLTLVLTYNGGALVDAVSRGNGETGERLLHTAMTIRNLPKVIPYQGYLQVRAEAIIPFSEFNRLIETEDYSNPRNLVAGTVRQFDASVAKERNVQAIVFEYINGHMKDVESDIDRLFFLKEQNFAVVNYEVFDASETEKIIDYCMSFNKTIRPTLPHMIDGLVIKVNDTKLREELGSTSKHPKWSCAFKFESMDAISTLRKVEWQVGKTGQITPVGHFDTVDIDGVMVSKATLHNSDYIKNKDIRIGDKIVVVRANDVIPQITQSIKEERSKDTTPIEIPTTCPICNHSASKVIIANGKESSSIFCQNPSCAPQLAGKIKHYVSRDAMNIDGLGEKTVDLLLNKGIISSIPELYILFDKPNLFWNIEGFGDRKFEKMVNGIEESKTRPLSQVLYALSIPMVGKSTAKILAKKFLSMENLIKATVNETQFMDAICNMEGIGDVVASNLLAFIKNNKDELLQELFDSGLTMKEELEVVVQSENNQVIGKTFVVTGDTKIFANRKELQVFIEKHGGKVSGSVSSKTNYLINNDIESNSGKNKDAKKLNIPIISEDDFMKMVN